MEIYRDIQCEIDWFDRRRHEHVSAPIAVGFLNRFGSNLAH